MYIYIYIYMHIYIYICICLFIYLFICLFIHLYTAYHETVIRTVYSIVPLVYASDFLDVRFCVTYQPYQKLKNDLSCTNILTYYAIIH